MEKFRQKEGQENINTYSLLEFKAAVDADKMIQAGLAKEVIERDSSGRVIGAKVFSNRGKLIFYADIELSEMLKLFRREDIN